MPTKLRLHRRFPPTREGWWFLVATLLVGAAALNGGINLMFLVFGMMIFLILASGVLSELCLRRLVVTRRPPSAIHAGSPYLMGIAVKNEKRQMPTFSLEVEDLIEGRPVERRCYYLKLPAGRTQETAYRNVLPKRGYHKLSGFRIATRFPFGLIRKSRDVDAPAQILVYPALVPVPEGVLPGARADAGRRAGVKPSRRGDFAGLREYRPGDDPRDIHWRTTARRGRPFIREAEDESGKTVIVVLAPERSSSSTDDPRAVAAAPTPAGGDPFEAAVSVAASIAVALTKRGYDVGLETSDGLVAPNSGPAQAAAILKALALVQPGGAVAAPLRGGPSLQRPTDAGGGNQAKAARRFSRVSRVVVRPAPGAPRIEGGGDKERRTA